MNVVGSTAETSGPVDVTPERVAVAEQFRRWRLQPPAFLRNEPRLPDLSQARQWAGRYQNLIIMLPFIAGFSRSPLRNPGSVGVFLLLLLAIGLAIAGFRRVRRLDEVRQLFHPAPSADGGEHHRLRVRQNVWNVAAVVLTTLWTGVLHGYAAAWGIPHLFWLDGFWPGWIGYLPAMIAAWRMQVCGNSRERLEARWPQRLHDMGFPLTTSSPDSPFANQPPR